MLVENPTDNSTAVLLVEPGAGRWKIEPQRGSTITSVETAEHEPAAEALGAVTGKGRTRTVSLAYHVPKGTSLSLVEVGTGVHRTIAKRVRGKRCERNAGSPGGHVLRCVRIRFQPKFGHDHTRRIEAVVTRGHVPIEKLVVAKFRAEKPKLPAKPRGLRLVRKGSKVTIAWRGARGAATYIGSVKRGTSVHVRIFSLRVDHEAGKPARLTLEPKQKRTGARGEIPRRTCR